MGGCRVDVGNPDVAVSDDALLGCPVDEVTVGVSVEEPVEPWKNGGMIVNGDVLVEDGAWVDVNGAPEVDVGDKVLVCVVLVRDASVGGVKLLLGCDELVIGVRVLVIWVLDGVLVIVCDVCVNGDPDVIIGCIVVVVMVVCGCVWDVAVVDEGV